jgi:hypothetical protein
VTSVLIAIGLGTGALGALAGQSAQSASTLGPTGIGKVRFGLAKVHTVADLSAIVEIKTGTCGDF